MMSRAFKVFLLMILGFGSLWAYQFRTRDLRAWLERGAPALGTSDTLPDLRSSVDRVIDPRKDSRALATIYFQEPCQAAEIPQEEVLADLPTRREAPPPPARAPAPARRFDPEEEPPEVIVVKEEAPRDPPRAKDARPTPPDAAKKEKEKAKPKDKPVEKPAEKPAEKPSEKKVERPRTDRTKATRPDPHALPADGSRPAVEPAQGLLGEAAKVPAPPAPSAGPAKSEPALAPSRRRTISHVVKEKETLASLARQYYQSDTGRWKEIFAANQARLPDPDALSPGMVIEIPDAAADRPAEAAGKSVKKPAAPVPSSKPKPKPPTRSG